MCRHRWSGPLLRGRVSSGVGAWHLLADHTGWVVYRAQTHGRHFGMYSSRGYDLYILRARLQRVLCSSTVLFSREFIYHWRVLAMTVFTVVGIISVIAVNALILHRVQSATHTKDNCVTGATIAHFSNEVIDVNGFKPRKPCCMCEPTETAQSLWRRHTCGGNKAIDGSRARAAHSVWSNLHLLHAACAYCRSHLDWPIDM